MLELPMIALLLVVPNDRKCPNPPVQMPGYELREPVLLVDGIIPARKDSLGLEAVEVASIRITCWDPATDSFAPDGIPIVRIQTKALVAATREPLLRLIEAQGEYRSRHERYATDLEALEEFGLDPDAALELESTESGWSASTPSSDVAYRCSANEASAKTVGEDGEPQLDCSPVDALALRSLRERYAAGG